MCFTKDMPVFYKAEMRNEVINFFYPGRNCAHSYESGSVFVLQYSSEEETRQMEEIVRLEREIERLQRQRDEGVALMNEGSREELCQRRDAEIYQLEKEASRVATEFLEMLDFGGLDPSLSSEENLNDSGAPLAEDDEDEGFQAEDEEECVPFPDLPSPPPAELQDLNVLGLISPPPAAFAQGLHIGSPLRHKHVLETLQIPDSAPPPPALPPPALFTQGSLDTSRPKSAQNSKLSSTIRYSRWLETSPSLSSSSLSHESSRPKSSLNPSQKSTSSLRSREILEQTSAPSSPPSGDYSEVPKDLRNWEAKSDYDQEEYELEEALENLTDGHVTDEEVLRRSCCTYNSMDSFRGSTESVRN